MSGRRTDTQNPSIIAEKNEEKPCSTCLQPIYRLIPGSTENQISGICSATNICIYTTEDLSIMYIMHKDDMNV